MAATGELQKDLRRAARGVGNRSRWSLIALVAIAVVLVSGALAGPAQGFHIPGATYTGGHGGPTAPPPPPGITLPPPSVELDVSADGLAVSRLRITNVGGFSCGVVYSQTMFPIPISNHAFNFIGGGDAWSGSFPSVRSAQGTFRSMQGCITGTVSWTATTAASPLGSEECKNAQAALASAQAAVATAQKAVNRAKKKLKRAADKKERAKARKKLKRARRELEKSRQQLQAAQAQQAAVCG